MNAIAMKYLYLLILLILVVVAGFFIFKLFFFQKVFRQESGKLPNTAFKPEVLINPQKPDQPPALVFETTPQEITHGNQKQKQVIFTFDAGSGVQSAQAILDTLKKHNQKATFFITGAFAEKNRNLVKAIAAAGHEIGNHTFSHPHLTQVSNEQISQELGKTENLIKEITGQTTRPYFRPPYGDRDQRVLNTAARAGYQSVYWTVDALDWKEDQGETAAQVKTKILSNLKPGTIFLMHLGDNITGQILDEIFNEVEKQGYGIKSLSEGLK